MLTILALVVFLFLITFILKNSSASRKEAEEIKKEALEKAAEILEKARTDASALLLETNKKAKEILQKEELFHQDVADLLHGDLKTFSDAQRKKIEESFQNLTEKYQGFVDNAEKNSSALLIRAQEAFETRVNDALKRTEGAVAADLKEHGKRREEAMEKWEHAFQEEARQYKKNKLARMDQAFEETFLVVAKDVFGKTLRREEQEEFVRRATEIIKEEGFFNT